MKVLDIEATGRHINELCKTKHLTISIIAKEIGVSPQSVSKWRCGQAIPSIDNLILLADLLDVDIDQLISTREI